MLARYIPEAAELFYEGHLANQVDAVRGARRWRPIRTWLLPGPRCGVHAARRALGWATSPRRIGEQARNAL